jgi:hypothetical protein
MSRTLLIAWGGSLLMLASCWAAADREIGFLLFYGLLTSVALASFLSAWALCRGAWPRLRQP